MYDISITTADGKITESKSETIAKALTDLRPELIKGKLVIEAKFGEKKLTKVILVPQARRMFYNPIALDIFARNIERALI